jgi:dolichol-phosphate mannosyltransferase
MSPERRDTSHSRVERCPSRIHADGEPVETFPTRRKCVMTAKSPTLSIVCPAYEEEAVLPVFHEKLDLALRPVAGEYRIEILYVDDGSRDRTLDVLRELAQTDLRVRYLSLSRNFGHQAALTAGLEHACGDVVVSLDSDLQHPPDLIPLLLARWREGYDVVLTERTDGPEVGWFKRFTSQQFYRLLQRLSDTEVRPACADFRLLSRPAVDALLRLRETHRFLRGMVNWLGFRVASEPYQVAPRAAGVSHYTLRRMLRLAGDGILSFSRVPLQLPAYAGLGSVGLGLLYALGTAGAALAGSSMAAWPVHLLLIVVLVLGGLILCAIGIVGEYVGRIYEQVKQRPIYLLKESSPAVGTPAAALVHGDPSVVAWPLGESPAA